MYLFEQKIQETLFSKHNTFLKHITNFTIKKIVDNLITKIFMVSTEFFSDEKQN